MEEQEQKQPRVRRKRSRKQRITDARQVSRLILRHVMEQDTEEAQALLDALEHEEALQRKAIRRQRAADRAECETDTPDRKVS